MTSSCKRSPLDVKEVHRQEPFKIMQAPMRCPQFVPYKRHTLFWIIPNIYNFIYSKFYLCIVTRLGQQAFLAKNSSEGCQWPCLRRQRRHDTTRLEFSVSNSKASICAFVGRGRALWKVTQPSRWVAWVTAELKIHQGHVLFFFCIQRCVSGFCDVSPCIPIESHWPSLLMVSYHHFCQPRETNPAYVSRRNPLITAIFWAFWPQLLLLPPGRILAGSERELKKEKG